MLFGAFLVASPGTATAAQEGGFVYELYGLYGTPTQANITDYVGPGGAISIPSTLGGYPVAVIDDYALSYLVPPYVGSPVTSIVIPSSVNTIGYCSFYHCDLLASVTVGSGVSNIGYGAFYGCPVLSSISFVGIVAPSSVGSDWVAYTSASILGHAYATSDFPPPGGSFHGLVMGENLQVMPTLPGAPRDLTATGGPGYIQLAWSSPTDGNPSFSRYDIYRRTAYGSYGDPIDSVAAGTLSYNDSTPTPGTLYYYVVRAVNPTGSGPASNEAGATATVPPSTPSAPRSLTAGAGPGIVHLTWVAPTSDGGSPITNYMVYRGTSSGGESLYVILGVTLGFDDENVVNGQTYYYKVSAANGVGEGPRSSGASASPCAVPGGPRLNEAIAGNGTVRLSWSPPSNDGGRPITNYRLYRGTMPSAETPLVFLENVLELSDTELTNGIEYFYRVAAINAVGEGPLSVELSATPFGVPSVPRGMHASAGSHTVDLNWTAPQYAGPGMIVYHLYRNGTELWNGIGLSYRDSPLVNGVTYSYRVSASNGVGYGPNTSIVAATPQGPPTEPIGLSATAGNGLVSLHWSSPAYVGPGPLVYHLFRDGTEIWSGSASAYADSSVVKGHSYSYEVAARNAIGWSENGTSATAEPFGVPDAPRGLAAAAGDQWIELGWSAPAYVGPGTIVYHLLRNGSEMWMGPGTGHVDRSVANGVEYTYSVVASNGVGLGPLSDEVSATPQEGDGAPSMVRGLVSHEDELSVALNWTEPSYLGHGSITYHLFRDAEIVWSGAGTEHLDAPLDKGVEHSYSVAAENAFGWGSNCTPVSATPFGVPDEVWGLSATSGNGLVSLSWNGVNYSGPGTLLYHLFREGTKVWDGTATSHVDAPLTKGLERTYTVSASNQVGWGENSSSVAAMPFGVPDAPWGLVAAPSDGSISLTWSSVNYSGPGTLVFHLFRDGVLAADLEVPSYHDVGLVNGQQHIYAVSASNSVGWSSNSSSVVATPEGPPTAPIGLGAMVGDTWVHLRWSPPGYPGPGILTFHLYRNGSLVWSGTRTEHNDTDVLDLVEYSYSVSAENSLGHGPNGSTVHATPMPREMTPTAPRDVVLVAGIGSVTVSWLEPFHSNASAVIEYELRYGNASGSLASSTTTSALSIVIGGLEKGRSYYFTVEARNSAGTGPNSSLASSAPFGPPDAPVGLQVVAGEGRTAMNWTAPGYAGPGTIIYHVFRDGVLVYSGGSLVCEDVGLVKGQAYSYTVSSNNSVGWGPNSTSASAVPFGVPSIPIDLNATSGENGIVLKWSAPDYIGPGTLIYHLYRDGVPLWNGTARTFLDAGAMDHKDHSYIILASNSIGPGDSSGVVQAKVPDIVINPADYTAMFAVAGAASVLAVLTGALMAWSMRRKPR